VSLCVVGDLLVCGCGSRYWVVVVVGGGGGGGGGWGFHQSIKLERVLSIMFKTTLELSLKSPCV